MSEVCARCGKGITEHYAVGGCLVKADGSSFAPLFHPECATAYADDLRQFAAVAFDFMPMKDVVALRENQG